MFVNAMKSVHNAAAGEQAISFPHFQYVVLMNVLAL
jgi:hypothetical protein